MINRLRPHKTQFFPLAPVFSDESTIEGNLNIHKTAEQALGRDQDSTEWDTKLKPYFGDLKTVLRILVCQSIRNTAERPFDSRRWIIPGLGLWHLHLNLCRLIWKIHFGGTYPADSSALQYAMDAWNRSKVDGAKDFTKLEALLIDSSQARIVALAIGAGGTLPQQNDDTAHTWMRKKGYDELLNKIFNQVNEFWDLD